MVITPPETIFHQNSHCGFCGTRFTEQKVWPRACFRCGNDSYKNPIPVVVALIPVFTIHSSQCGWLIEKRGIEPKKGEWALPGGYIEFGETWQHAVVREMQEEVGLTTKAEDWNLLEIVNSINGNMLLFCSHKGVQVEEIKFSPNREVEDIAFPILPEEKELCFPSHNEMWVKYYQAIS